MYDHGIVVLHRDFRIHDNTCVLHALGTCKKVSIIFIFTPSQVDRKKNRYFSSKSLEFLIECLEDLGKDVHVNILYGEPSKVLKSILTKLGEMKKDNVGLFFNRDYTPFAKKREQSYMKAWGDNDCVHVSEDYYLFPPGSIRTDQGSVYQKFTPFYNNCLLNSSTIASVKNVSASKKSKIVPLPLGDALLSISQCRQYLLGNKSTEEQRIVVGTRSRALSLVRKLMTKVDKYNSTRDDLTKETSKLSAFLKYGVISVRELYHKVKTKGGLQSPYIRQLIWRDFYMHIVNGFPRVLQGKSLKPSYDNIQWEDNKEWKNAWMKGETGFPIVDANMRMLNETGYMHNRGRLIVAAWLVKLALVDWRIGEKYFATQLVDYDPASNNGNWQWISGSGADSMPYFRIFNPWSQSKKHDKDALFIKKWCPELEGVSAKHIHEWDTYCDEYKKAGIKYPAPIFDYATQRARALDMYKQAL